MSGPSLDIDALAQEVRRINYRALTSDEIAEALAPHIAALAQPSAGAVAVAWRWEEKDYHGGWSAKIGFVVTPYEVPERWIRNASPLYDTPQPDARDAAWRELARRAWVVLDMECPNAKITDELLAALANAAIAGTQP